LLSNGPGGPLGCGIMARGWTRDTEAYNLKKEKWLFFKRISPYKNILLAICERSAIAVLEERKRHISI
jgi:hypothetical protein